MDCIEFTKLIGPYLREELSDAELNEFLHHLDSCAQCDEELEISYIVGESMERLDKDHADYDLSRAYRSNKAGSRRYIASRKHMIRLAYVMDTAVFWVLVMTIFVYFRILLTGD